jgi:hypothetical protein
MIHYQLRCSADHAFDGWFRDSAAFDEQAQRGLVTCPACGGTEVMRALMAPALGRRRAAPIQVTSDGAPDPAPAQPTPAVGGAMPDQVRAALQRLRAEVEKRCDNVGDGFAEEARRIHNGESPARGIYGDATPEEAERLADEGIEVAQIPWLPRSDS